MSPSLVAAAALAAGVAVAAFAGPLSAAPLVWLAVLVLAALAPRGVRAVAMLAALGAVLGARDERAWRAARARLGPLDQAGPVALAGTVRGPIEEGPAGWRFGLEVDGATIEVAVSGPESIDLLPGDAIAVDGRLRSGRGFLVPGAIDGERQLAARGAVAALATTWPALERTARGRAGPDRALAAARRALVARLAGPERTHALLTALVLGARGAVEPEVADAWRDAGMSHLLAVSGMHLAAVALLGFALLRRGIALLWSPADPGRAAAGIALALAVAYTGVCGAPPSAVRALIALTIHFGGIALGRRARAVDAVGHAALVLLAYRPAALFDPSLQLSLVATLAVAWAAGRPADPPELGSGGLARLERAAWSSMRIALAAGLATAPLTAAWFGTIQPGGPIANLVAGPLTELIALPLGLLAALLGAVGAPLAAVARAALAAADRIAAGVSGLVPTWWCGPPRGHELVLAAAVLLAIAVAARRRHVLALIGGGLVALTWTLGALAPRWQGATRVSFVDVGQGDAALIEPPGGGAWLIDAGGRPGAAAAASPGRRRRAEEAPGAAVLDLLGHRRVRRLGLVVLSHPHPDHYLGLRAIARRVAIDEVWLALAPGRPLPPDLAGLLARLHAGGTRVVDPAGHRLVARGRAHLWIASGPPDPLRSVNDDSLVVALEVGRRRVLFLGDLEGEGEAALRGDLAADVVKVAHHGSATSSTAALVAATRPSLAVISCGPGNRFGFPAAAVLERWRAVGAAIRRTDRHGTIVVTIAADDAMTIESAR